MSPPTETKQWLLNEHPKGLPTYTGDNPTWKQTTTSLPALKDGQVLLKLRYLSNDPAQRGWMDHYDDPSRLYVPPIKKGEVMRAGGLSEVIESKASNLKQGDIVQAGIGWTQYSVQDAKNLTALQALPNGLPITHYLGALGGTGQTAYYGIVDIARTSASDVVVISGAAGAAGSMAVQIAKKMLGAKTVIGIAGGAEKCAYVKSLGADDCLDYKSDSWKEQLAKLTPEYVDVYFDNVGGSILDYMLTRMAREGRIAACGAISAYNDRENAPGIKNWFPIIAMRLQVKGFIVLDNVKNFGENAKKMRSAIEEGKLRIDEEAQTVVRTAFEDVPKTWLQLFEGRNRGKLVTEVV